MLSGQIEFQLLYTLQNYLGVNRFRKKIEDEALNWRRSKQISRLRTAIRLCLAKLQSGQRKGVFFRRESAKSGAQVVG